MPSPFHGPSHSFARAACIAGALVLCPILSASAQQSTSLAASDASETQLKAWHENLRNYAPLESGCFQTSYPSVHWDKVACGPTPGFISSHKAAVIAAAAVAARGSALPLETAGNGTDYVAQTAGTTKSSVGTFPVASGITSEQSVGVAAYGNGGILGSNEYSLQLNSDINPSSVACSAFGYSNCYVWEQFVYSTAGTVGRSRYPSEVFIQNWVFPSTTDYRRRGCPRGWQDESSSGNPACVVNSSATAVTNVAPTSLGTLKLSGTVSVGGNDTLIFTEGTKAYSASQADSTVHLGSWWRQSEFNVVGNAGGSEAVFNSGVSLTLNVVATDGSTSAPTCVANSGTTGESNNLNLGSCSATAGSSPSITFTESD